VPFGTWKIEVLGGHTSAVLLIVLAIAALVGGKYFGATWLDPVMGLVGTVLVARWSGESARAEFATS